MNTDITVVEKLECAEVETVKLCSTVTLPAFDLKAKLSFSFGTFTAAANGSPVWSIGLTPTLNNEYYSVYLILRQCKWSQVTINLKFSLFNENGEVVTKEKKAHNIEQNIRSGFEKFVSTIALSSLIEECELKLLCEVSYMTNNFTIIGEPHKADLGRDLCQHFKNLVNSDTFSDVVLTAGGQEFKAHKVILAARSRVFAEMLQYNFEGIINLHIDSDVLQQMLNFIYTGNVPKLDEMAMDLLAVADRFELKKLKEMCEESLRAKLCIETLAATITAANYFNSSNLMSAALTFLNLNAEEIVKTPIWNVLRALHSDFILEAYKALAVKPTDKMGIL